MTTNDQWPTTQFAFQLCWGEAVFSFAEVSGLEIATPNQVQQTPDTFVMAAFSPQQLSLQRLSFKRGLYRNNISIENWLEPFCQNEYPHQSADFQLLDEHGSVLLHYRIDTPRLHKITQSSPPSAPQTAAVELLVVQYKYLTTVAR